MTQLKEGGSLVARLDSLASSLLAGIIIDETICFLKIFAFFRVISK
jgi:hypothetical protein